MNTTNCEINWNGSVPEENDCKTMPINYPFVIEKMDLSFLNRLLGTNFRPTVWIGIPN